MAQKEKDPAKVILGKHVICFPHLAKPSSFKDSDKQDYSIEFLIPEGHPDVDKLLDAIDYVYDSNKESVFKGAKMTGRNFHNPLRHGDEVLDEYPNREEVEGHYVIKAKTSRKPAVYDENGDEMYDVEEIKSGDWCRGVIVFRPFSHDSGKKGISCYLNSVKFMEEGEQIGGFAASHDDYDDEPAGKRGRTSKPARRDDDRPARRRTTAEDEDTTTPPPVRQRRRQQEEPPQRRRRPSQAEEDDDIPF